MKRILVKFLEWMIFLCMSVMAIAVVFQVFSRYVLHDPSKYSEEIATTLMIWVGTFGAALGFERGAHLGVDLLEQMVNPSSQKMMRIISICCIFIFAVVIWCWGGWEITAQAFQSQNTFKTMPWLSRGWAYFPIPLSGIMVSYFMIGKFIQEVRRG